MTQRSFSLANASNQAKAHRDFWSSSQDPLSPSERKGEDSTEVNNLEKDLGAMGLKSARPEDDSNIDTEITLPHKVTPVIRSSVAKSTNPSLRPKRIPMPPEQTTGLVAKTLPSPSPIVTDRSTLSSKPLEKKSPPFNERYEKVTTYLEKPLFHRVHELHQRGEIAKIASLLNAAVREYLDRHYPSS